MDLFLFATGVYILQNTMARGGGIGAGEKMKNESVRNKMKKKKKGERKKKKRMWRKSARHTIKNKISLTSHMG